MAGKRRTYAKRSGSKTAKRLKTSVVPRGIPRPSDALLGNNKLVKLKYVEAFNLNPGASGVPATHVWSANGMYDPNITGVGHQPRGFDQLMALYDHFWVKSSTITVDFASTSNDAIAPFTVGISLQDDSSPEGDMIQACENRSAVYRITTDSVSPRLSLGFDSKSYFYKFKNDLLGSDGGNPADQAYFVVFAQPANSTSDLGNINCVVTIEYTALLSEPNNVAAS